MKTKLIFALVLMVFIIPSFVSAQQQDLGTAVKGDCVNLIQTCDTCTYNNITRILFPNSSQAITSEVAMTKSETYYNYSFCITDTIGTYIVLGHGDLDSSDTVWTYNFDITGGGESVSTAKSIMYIGLLVVLILLLVISIFGIFNLPSGDNKNDDGKLVSINKLKYLRIVLFFTTWMVLTSILFTSANIGLAYFSGGMFGNLLFKLYSVMFSLTLPMVIFTFIYIFVGIFKDKETKSMIDRGMVMGDKI